MVPLRMQRAINLFVRGFVMTKLMRNIVLCILMLAFAVPALAGDKAPALTEEQKAMLEAALENLETEIPIAEEFRVKVDADDLSAVEGLDGEWMNILLLGTDTGNLQLNYGRTDAMLIASINTKTGKVKLASLVRDMLVNIPVVNWENRINAANAFGGPLLAVKTVNETLGLNITRYCSVNFRGFENIIDSLGGVQLLMSEAEARQAGVPVSDGAVTLNGQQALAYVRIRSLDNNFGRNNRQRKLLDAVLVKGKASPMDRALVAITEAFKSMDTNITMSEVIKLAPIVLKNADTMDMLSLPRAGQYRNATHGQMSVIVFDAEKTRETIHQFIYNDGQ
jgi:LCP family protein required for cell wall assembly